MAKTIGMLTGGGDCPGLNAVIRAVTRRSLTRTFSVPSLAATCLGMGGAASQISEPTQPSTAKESAQMTASQVQSLRLGCMVRVFLSFGCL